MSRHLPGKVLKCGKTRVSKRYLLRGVALAFLSVLVLFYFHGFGSLRNILGLTSDATWRVSQRGRSHRGLEIDSAVLLSIHDFRELRLAVASQMKGSKAPLKRLDVWLTLDPVKDSLDSLEEDIAFVMHAVSGHLHLLPILPSHLASASAGVP